VKTEVLSLVKCYDNIEQESVMKKGRELKCFSDLHPTSTYLLTYLLTYYVEKTRNELNIDDVSKSTLKTVSARAMACIKYRNSVNC